MNGLVSVSPSHSQGSMCVGLAVVVMGLEEAGRPGGHGTRVASEAIGGWGCVEGG